MFLKTPIQIEEKHLAIVKNILQKYPISFYAYGSRARWYAYQLSDLDLCFFEPIPKIYYLEQELEESDLLYKVDLTYWHDCKPSFQNIIAKDLICIQASNELLKVEESTLGHFKYLPKKATLNSALDLKFKVEESENLTIINSSLNSSMFNIVYGKVINFHGDIESRISQIIKSFKGQPFAWWLPASQKTYLLAQMLSQAGFVTDNSFEYNMICDLTSWQPTIQNISKSPENFIVSQVTNYKQLEDFINVLAEYDNAAIHFYQALSIEMLQEQEKLFVGYHNSEPVCIGGLFTQADISYVFNIMTKEAFRNQGFGTSMTYYLMKTAKANGIKYATLIASGDSGYNIYRKLQFKTLGLLQCFEYPQKT